jgi:hypothetical protein
MKQTIYNISHRHRLVEARLTLNGWNIPFVEQVKYIGVMFDERITWRFHIEVIEAKAFRTFIRVYSIFRSERLSANIKLALHKALIRSVMTYACPAWQKTCIYCKRKYISVLCYMCNMYTWQRPSLFVRDKPIISWERMLYEDYDCKSSVTKRKTSGHVPQDSWRQDELIGSKPLVVSNSDSIRLSW